MAPVMALAQIGEPQREPHPDPHYGHEGTAKMSARFMHELFKCSSIFCHGGVPDASYPTLDEFIGYALFISESDLYVHYYAMYLIWRMHVKDPALRANHSHETYLAALMVATRAVMPDEYALKPWCKVGQSIYSLEQLVENERRLCKMVNWELEAESMRVEMIQEQIEMKYGEPSEECESSDEWESDDSSSVLSAETPDTSPLPSDSDSSSSGRRKAVGECVWW